MIQITGWAGDRADEMVRLPRNVELSGSLSDLHVSFYSHFSAHARKFEHRSFDLVEQLPRYDVF